ncbi:DUF2183 domain-containing protein [Aquimarina sp. ERC-38]|uniref:App1 family protein n=1 Tax=Aquimarina sp. ERC-38 TaxID=2949996 RepID=UPI0022483AF6|nr:phosphatase domain-containing protein [Aquimarina sp. ERC-38]UZO81064.1 DUF2183 domain-containing protein [Aquimarina sp. ERC-38]
MFRKKPYRINTYLSYGTLQHFRAQGRALEYQGVNFEGNTNVWQTLKNIYKQFESDEIRNTALEIKLSNGTSFETTTDKEGYFKIDEVLQEPYLLTDQDDWLPYTVSFKNTTDHKIIDHNIFKGKMLLPERNASYGIISDIDDTILHTGVASVFKWRLVANTFFKNFDRRMPLEGTSEFYKKLHSGKKGDVLNPIFYVSNSPWNLHDYLAAFLSKNQFPEGPILLRDFRNPFEAKPKKQLPHKEAEISTILESYPELKFILIGDSGEKDADIYIKTAKKFPGRILAIYVRNVNHLKRDSRITELLDTFNEIPTLLVKTSQQAEEHAKKHGFIS